MARRQKPLPQLRLRTEHSFRRSYAPISEVVARCVALDTPAAACVDPNTWGHVRWEKACVAAGVAPLFGVEWPVAQTDGRKPLSWLLAEEPGALYRFVSAGETDPGAWSSVSGCVRFAGNGLDDPELFDYIDLNPGSPRANLRALELHQRTGKPLVVTSDAWYPAPEDRDVFLALTDNRRTTPQHILPIQDLRAALPEVNAQAWTRALRGTREVAERLAGARLPRAPLIDVPGDLAVEVEKGRRDRLALGHIPAWTDAYQQRLERELTMIREKEFESYFLVVGDLVRWAKDRMLVGPARGSSAGSLVCYLLRITEVDPLVHQLLFERFIDVNRADLPDIDIDFSDRHREQVFEYLAEKYGAANVARLGNVSTLKPRSVLAECGKRLGIPLQATYAVRNVLIEHSSGDARYGSALQDTLEQTTPGREFIERHPEASVMLRAEGHAWHTSVHAAGVIVSNRPITDFCSVVDGVCQVDKASSEHLNLLKIDALGLRTLGVIEDAGCVTAEELYALTLDDPEVFEVFNAGRFAGVFQFEGGSQRRVARQIPTNSFQQLDHITALARPGPLGGGATNTYINRNDGREPVRYRHPSMADYLGDTKGVVLYQEQVMRIVRELGQFSWSETSTIRKAMSGRKGVEYFDRQREAFVKGAAERGVDERAAIEIFDEICSFGAWGMNKSHTVSYAIISYWCGYMKAYHPLEYAAALLRNAKDDEQVMEMLRELKAEGLEYKAFDPERSQEHWAVIDGMLVGGFRNLAGVGPATAARLLATRESGWSAKDRALVAKARVAFNDLSPAHTMWGDWYANPTAHNIRGAIKQFAELEDKEEAVVICRLVRKDRRDENEQVRRNRRGGKLYRGQSLFLDAFVVDDSVAKPVLLRLRTNQWRRYGEPLADRGRDGEDWFLVRGRWLDQFSMLAVDKIRCLTQEDMFDAQARTAAVRRDETQQA